MGLPRNQSVPGSEKYGPVLCTAPTLLPVYDIDDMPSLPTENCITVFLISSKVTLWSSRSGRLPPCSRFRWGLSLGLGLGLGVFFADGLLVLFSFVSSAAR